MSGARGGRGGSRRPPQSALLTELGRTFNTNKGSAQLFPEYRDMPVAKQPTYEEKHMYDLYKGYLDELNNSEFYLTEPPVKKGSGKSNGRVKNEGDLLLTAIASGEEDEIDEDDKEDREGNNSQDDAAWDEEDEEEENDYVNNYFDNGEGDEFDFDDDDGDTY
ncbi:hypothetical protein AX774_g7704 [Zancudomyces culisetae]|uniref:DNA-directed RNA polymerase III subunit n=1 Tax=Zancudomyces culisetae TaxID=1213189 RepID=A0A1R1PD32_ZANCU|nr:hypothetical protein AX774_g7704 [Zancudomyces culisetae]|eukprot:OMH78895.1 hypothetical protein AX774_g7704 [Zancudomyces culisetae]